MRGDVLIVTLAISLAYLQYTNACSCMPSHPQTDYCNSDFVILARVQRERPVGYYWKKYKVRVRKSYKLSEKAETALKSGQLLTALDEAMCGVNLEVGKVYAIAGNVQNLKAHIGLCGMITPWRDLTRRQRKGLKMLYKHGCSCRINYCKFRKCTKTPDSCILTSDCHINEGICLRQKNKKCMWTRNNALATCLKPHENSTSLTISRWSG